jgi:glycosyl transferase, family 25
VTLTHRDIPIWLINLPRATERRAKMDAQLAPTGLSYTVFDGVDGKAEEARLLQSVDVRAFERNMGRKILIGGIGCYHSHLGVWRAFLDSGAPVALVLEDDVVLHDDFWTAIDHGLAIIDHWDFLKLNCIRAKLKISQGRIGPYHLNAYAGPATGTGAYLITRETAARLLPAMLPVTRATDHEINRFFIHDFRLFGLEPFPSHLDDGNVSLITGTGFADVRKFKWYRRLPNYGLRLGNYLRRVVYLARKGRLFPSQRELGVAPGPRLQQSENLEARPIG